MILLIAKDINDKDDYLDQDIYFLDNKTDLFNGNNNHNSLPELDNSNVEMYINGKKKKFQKYYKFPNKGIYKIKLKFKILMTDCSNMLYNSIYLTDIDLTNFKMKEVTNMAYMFCGCKNLKSIDLSSLNTKNVTIYSGMFGGCMNLTSLDLSSFDSKKLTDMSGMFAGCFNLKKIDLTPMYTKNDITWELCFLIV